MASNNKNKRNRLWKVNPHCYYCDVLTVRPEDLGIKGISNNIPDNMATLEHLYTRMQVRRMLTKDKPEVVLACDKCNREKNMEVLRTITDEELAITGKTVYRKVVYSLSAEQRAEIKRDLQICYTFNSREKVGSFIENYLNNNDFKKKYNVSKTYMRKVLWHQELKLISRFKNKKQNEKGFILFISSILRNWSWFNDFRNVFDKHRRKTNEIKKTNG